MNRNDILGEINAMHQLLAAHDYIGIKIATGRATQEDYAAEIEQMCQWAANINQLNLQLAALDKTAQV